MTVDEVIKKLQELSKQGYGDRKAVFGQWQFNYDGFSPKGEIKSCEIVKSREDSICAIAIN